MKKIFKYFILISFAYLSLVASPSYAGLTQWPMVVGCHPFQGQQFYPNVVGDIDCTVSTVAFPGDTTNDRCITINYPDYAENGSYKINNSTRNTLFVPLKTKEEWMSFVSSKDINGFTVERCETKGQCGRVTELKTLALPPPKAFLCKSGQATIPQLIFVGGPAPVMWAWTCEGTPAGGENDAKCNTISTEIIDGTCGAADNAYSEQEPTTKLCGSGAPSLVVKELVVTTLVNGESISLEYWTWNCNSTPIEMGKSAYCKSAPKQVATAACGAINGTTITAAPTSDQLCSIGSGRKLSESRDSSGNTVFSWTCISNNRITEVACGATMSGTNGACGFITGTTVDDPTTSPTSMCSKGKAINVKFNPSILRWEWICEGINGGDNSPKCIAIGRKGCGIVNGHNVGRVALSSNTIGMCAYTYNSSTPVLGGQNSSVWTWTCTGTSSSREAGRIYNCSATGE